MSFCFISGDPVSARSSFIISPNSSFVVGGGVTQEVVIAIKYFAGDGEGITETRIRPVSIDNFKIDSLKSKIGQVEFEGNKKIINYRMKPPVRESIDTLKIYGAVTGNRQHIDWHFELFSTASPEIAHEVTFSWSVKNLELPDWKVTPKVIYQGERTDLRLDLNYHNRDRLKLTDVDWHFPPEIKLVDTPILQTGRQWENGENTELKEVKVDPTFLGDLQIRPVVSLEGFPDVFLSAQKIRIDRLPRVAIVGDVLIVGEQSEIKVRWFNDGNVSMPLSSLFLKVHQSFSDVFIKDGYSGAVIETNENGRFVVVNSIEALEPGEQIEVLLNLVAQRPGPFLWESMAYPVGEREAVPLSGALTVVAVWDQKIMEYYDDSSPTDLQLFSKAVRDGMSSQMQGLPLTFNQPILLKAEGENESNWVVEDVISSELRKKGYEIVVRSPDDGTAFATVYYRLVSSRVNYLKKTRWLSFFDAKAKREVFVDVLMRFQDNEGVVRWQRRIRAYDVDHVSTRQIEVYGGGNSIKQTVIESDNKIIERGLSAGIVGGLIYIFFIL